MTDSYTFGRGRGDGLRVSEEEFKNQIDRNTLNPAEFFGTNEFGDNSECLVNNNRCDGIKVRTLEENDVEYIFGVPGDIENEFFKELSYSSI